MKDFYYILGLDINCTAVEIGLAYRKLSEKFRPDLNHHDLYFENRYREINEAFDVLSDPVRRSKYNAELKAFEVNKAKPVKKKGFMAKTQWVDVVFTLVLIAITVIFGRYVLQSVTASKAKKVLPQVTIAAVPVQTVKHYQKKKKFKATYVAHVQKAGVNAKAAVVSVPEPTRVIGPQPVRAIAVVDHTSNKPVIKKSIEQNEDDLPTNPGYLFTAYLKANETGVINLREYDSFRADIIRVLPNNTKVYVLEKAGNYCKVAYEGTVGYVPKWTIGAQ
ncbi:SH3 domain-containing protein [Mucilaginibacter lacusdianchii]|uniref:SH3 domain-containing protein n=1 Tax=Mucilaginibacter lacusdianchii TaxID=2684211 RepID=UPI00131BC387|nr:SH3 domain-containing protein [Mucilaginibacter sp. JXJ CY 39]